VLTIQAIVKAGIPVQGHIGLTPQTASALGGFKMQGRDALAAKRIVEDAKALEDAGGFSMILEAVPAPLGQLVAEAVKVPVIGIGAGHFPWKATYLTPLTLHRAAPSIHVVNIPLTSVRRSALPLWKLPQIITSPAGSTTGEVSKENHYASNLYWSRRHGWAVRFPDD